MLRPFAIASVIALGIAAALHAGGAAASEWLFTPDGRVATDYADNPRMLRDRGESSSGVVGQMGATLRRRTDLSELSLRPRVRISRYRDDESLDSDDQYLTLAFSRSGEKSEWSASADLTRDTTLTSELGSTGLVQTNRRHEALVLSAGPNFLLTERVNAGAQIYWVDNHYVDAGFTGLVDYQYRALSAFGGLARSSRSNLTLTAQGGELIVPDQDSTTRDATLRLGWRYRPHSLWTLDLSAGPAYVQSDYGSDSGVVFSADLQRQDERWTVSTKVGRELSPTGRGVLTRRDQISATVSRRITERLSGGGSVRLIRNRDLLPQPGVVFDEVTYSRLDLWADWRIAEHWSVSLAAGGATQEYDSVPGSAQNSRVSLSIVWNGQARSL